MKYIITEQQSDRLKKTILDYFDDYLTPFEGWEHPKSYEKDVIDIGEIFFHLDNGNQNYMWYSACDNLMRNEDSNGCPSVTLPYSTFNTLDGFFGDLWKSVFLEWFNMHTGLLVKIVDTISHNIRI